MDNNSESKIKLSRMLGGNVPELISKLVITGAIPAIEELVVNAYDADATRVDLTYNEEKNMLSIKDNGSGMKKGSGLEDFFRLGDSPKMKEPISPRGRVRIGKFGVATILLNYLCNEYEMVTVKDGIKTIIKEKFDGQLSQNKEILGEEYSIDNSGCGTEILMKGLRFQSEKQFSLEELKNQFQWDLPILPDFEIFINDEKIKPKLIEASKKFKVEKDLEHAGKVNAKFYVTPNVDRHAGIYVYVNKRAIGDPRAYLARLFSRGKLIFSRRLIGIVNADGLERAILFDRGRFREDDPGVIELEKLLKDATTKIASCVEEVSHGETRSKVEKKIPVFAKKIKGKLEKAGIEGITRKTEIECIKDLLTEGIGRYDSEKNRIYLNLKAPQLRINPMTTEQKYERAMMEATVEILALNRTTDLNSFLEKKAKIWRIIQGVNTKEIGRGEINPLRIYDISELPAERSYQFYNKLISLGILPHQDDEIYGRDVIKVNEQFKGFIWLDDLINEKSEFKINNINTSLLSLNLKPFIYNISKTGIFHVVESSCSRKILQIINTNRDKIKNILDEMGDSFYTMNELSENSEGLTALDISQTLDYARKNSISIERRIDKHQIKNAYAEIKKSIDEMGDSFYTMNELSENSEGLTALDVGRVLSYASKKSINIEKRIEENYMHFRYRDFIKALQLSRGNGEIIS
ncbi:MAG: ATP-binding protein [Nanoarchaeota archaeon]